MRQHQPSEAAAPHTLTSNCSGLPPWARLPALRRSSSGVVDEDVDAPGLADDLFGPGLQRGIVGDVHGDRVDAGVLQMLHAFDAAGAGVHGVAGPGEFEGGGFTDAGGGAGDEGHFVCTCIGRIAAIKPHSEACAWRLLVLLTVGRASWPRSHRQRSRSSNWSQGGEGRGSSQGLKHRGLLRRLGFSMRLGSPTGEKLTAAAASE